MTRKIQLFALALLSVVGAASAQIVMPNPIGGGGGGSSTITATNISAAMTCTDAVGTDAYACSATNCPAALADKQVVIFEAGTLNTGAATFAFCGFTAKAIVRPQGGVSTALVTGDILAKQPTAVYYHLADDNWKMFSVQASAGLLSSTQSWTGTNTFSNAVLLTTGTGYFVLGSSVGSHGDLVTRTANTPDASMIETGTLSNSYHIREQADFASDLSNGRCGTSACTSPALILFSPDASATEYGQASVDTTGAFGLQSNFAEIRVGGTKTAITESTPIAIARVAIGTSTNVYGLTLDYTIYDLNGSNYVTRHGSVKVGGGNASGTATCTINASQDTEAEDGSQIATSNAYTLTYTWTNVVATTNCDISLNAVSSAGTNTYAITWTAILTGNSSGITVTAQ